MIATLPDILIYIFVAFHKHTISPFNNQVFQLAIYKPADPWSSHHRINWGVDCWNQLWIVQHNSCCFLWVRGVLLINKWYLTFLVILFVIGLGQFFVQSKRHNRDVFITIISNSKHAFGKNQNTIDLSKNHPYKYKHCQLI